MVFFQWLTIHIARFSVANVEACLTSDILNGVELIQPDAQAVADWATDNELEINLNRSKVMILDSEAYIPILSSTSILSYLS